MGAFIVTDLHLFSFASYYWMLATSLSRDQGDTRTCSWEMTIGTDNVNTVSQLCTKSAWFALVLFVIHWMSDPNLKHSEISRMPHVQREREKKSREKNSRSETWICIRPALLLLALNRELAPLWPSKGQNGLFREQKELGPLLEREAALTMVGRQCFCFVSMGKSWWSLEQAGCLRTPVS